MTIAASQAFTSTNEIFLWLDRLSGSEKPLTSSWPKELKLQEIENEKEDGEYQDNDDDDDDDYFEYEEDEDDYNEDQDDYDDDDYYDEEVYENEVSRPGVFFTSKYPYFLNF